MFDGNVEHMRRKHANLGAPLLLPIDIILPALPDIRCISHYNSTFQIRVITILYAIW